MPVVDSLGAHGLRFQPRQKDTFDSGRWSVVPPLQPPRARHRRREVPDVKGPQVIEIEPAPCGAKLFAGTPSSRSVAGAEHGLPRLGDDPPARLVCLALWPPRKTASKLMAKQKRGTMHHSKFSSILALGTASSRFFCRAIFQVILAATSRRRARRVWGGTLLMIGFAFLQAVRMCIHFSYFCLSVFLMPACNGTTLETSDPDFFFTACNHGFPAMTSPEQICTAAPEVCSHPVNTALDSWLGRVARSATLSGSLSLWSHPPPTFKEGFAGPRTLRRVNL